LLLELLCLLLRPITQAGYMVFLFLFRQVLRQPVAIFANNILQFLRYWQKIQRPSGCYRKAVTILAAQSSSSRQPLLSCKPLHSFHLHFTTGLRTSTPSVSFRFHSFQPLAVHRLPVLGSPAGRFGLRLIFFICLRQVGSLV
jgi:hypothetical protein